MFELSDGLISQFVKATNDTKKAPKETTVYGTTVEVGGIMYVRMDGSELLTPVSSTADTKDGERVSVKIKNHTAMIDGNVSSPSARTDDVKAVVESVGATNAALQKITDSLSTLITDGKGGSLMTQTEDGWTFSTLDIENAVNSTAESLNDLIDEVDTAANTINTLQKAVDDMGVITEYVKITTYEGEPCIELGEKDSEFKLLITNTRIMFMEGTIVPAYISNQALNINKAVVNELEIHDSDKSSGGFVWKVRSNGNMGLVWKGASV